MYELLARFWIGVVKLFRYVPMSARNRIATVVGRLLWWAIPKRRHVTLTNLRLCFPEKTEAERVKLAHSLYKNMARAALDHGVLWAGTAEEVDRMVRFEGIESVTGATGRPIIVI